MLYKLKTFHIFHQLISAKLAYFGFEQLTRNNYIQRSKFYNSILISTLYTIAEWGTGLWPIYRLEVCRGIAVLFLTEATDLSLHDTFQTGSVHVPLTKLCTQGVPS